MVHQSLYSVSLYSDPQPSRPQYLNTCISLLESMLSLYSGLWLYHPEHTYLSRACAITPTQCCNQPEKVSSSAFLPKPESFSGVTSHFLHTIEIQSFIGQLKIPWNWNMGDSTTMTGFVLRRKKNLKAEDKSYRRELGMF